MKDVCARTGLARSTIHHYIREGLLPRPAKTGRNMAYYDDDFVQRAQLIKALQQKTHLPLAAIRDTLNGLPNDAVGSIDPSQFVEITRTIADNLRLAFERDVDESELVESAGLAAEDLRALARVGLIEPVRRDGKALYSPLDARIARAFARIREAGVAIGPGARRVVEAYRQHLTQLARLEAREAVRAFRSVPAESIGEFTRKTMEASDELFGALHRKALVRAHLELTEDDSREGTNGST
jgi:DNA-binding transcriptional MerR regulator